jgi:hypothetical protein
MANCGEEYSKFLATLWGRSEVHRGGAEARRDIFYCDDTDGLRWERDGCFYGGLGELVGVVAGWVEASFWVVSSKKSGCHLPVEKTCLGAKS